MRDRIDNSAYCGLIETICVAYVPRNKAEKVISHLSDFIISFDFLSMINCDLSQARLEVKKIKNSHWNIGVRIVSYDLHPSDSSYVLNIIRNELRRKFGLSFVPIMFTDAKWPYAILKLPFSNN